jgi:aryl-alcohol dehydrogenase-like predicted oxidoreductase
MHAVTLPGADLSVSSLCLGTSEFGSRVAQTDAFRMLDAFVAAGGTFLDTANVYADWVPGTKSTSEKTLGAWLAARHNRDQVVLATKGGHPRLESMHHPRLAPANLIHDVDQSLHHLRTECIDLYWLHRDDPQRPVGEILETLADLRRAGKLAAIGCSNWARPRIQAAQEYAAQHGLPGFVADQMLWNLAVLDRGALGDPTLVAMDLDLYRYHRATGLAAIPYSAQANGLFQKLAGRQAQRGGPLPSHYPLAPNRARLRRAEHLARTLGVSLTAIVLGYLQSQPFVTVPIVGCRTLDQLHDSLAGDGVRLTPEQLTYLEAET